MSQATDREMIARLHQIGRLQDERDAAIGEREELRERYNAAQEDIELLRQRLDVEKNRYGEAIRLMHHGLRQTMEGATDPEAFDREAMLALVSLKPATLKALTTLAIGIGYAYALEVMTRRAAPDHLQAGVDWMLKDHAAKAGVGEAELAEMKQMLGDLPILSLYEGAMRAFPKPPHVAYEEDHGNRS